MLFQVYSLLLNETFVKNFNYKNPTLQELFEFRLMMLKDNPDILHLIEGDKLDALAKNSHINYKEHVKTLLPAALDHYDIAFISAGLDSITRLWLQDDVQISCKQMAIKSVELIDSVLTK